MIYRTALLGACAALALASQAQATGGGGMLRDVDAQAYIAATPVVETPEQARALLTFVISQKTCGNWDKLTTIMLWANAAESAAQINVKNPAQVATLTGTPTWTTTGYKPDGSSNYVRVPSDPVTAGLVAGDLFVASYARINQTSNGVLYGNSGSTGSRTIQFRARSPTDTMLVAMSTSGWAGLTGNTDASGFWATEVRGTTGTIYKQGAVYNTQTVTNGSGPNATAIYVGARNANGSVDSYDSNEQSAFIMGKSLGGYNHVCLYNGLRAYLTFYGA